MDFAFRDIDGGDGGGFDFAHDGTDLVIDDGLLTALAHSLFRDGRAPAGALREGEDPRGHWSTSLEPGAPDGSLLWLLRREKITPDMPARVAAVMERACAWMISATTGPAAPVTRILAQCRKAERRGRIDGTLEVGLRHALAPRRFRIVYDDVSRTYSVKEIT